jgi:hypothetical protein
VSATAASRIAPDAATMASWAAIAAKRLGAAVNARPHSAASSAITPSAKPGGALSPVPTAVAPIASSRLRGRVAATAPAHAVSCAAQPDASCPAVTGVASIRWVRPIFTTPAHAAALASSAAASARRAGTTRSSRAIVTATLIAVGNASFDEWPRLT